ncbi:MAG TPA: aldehyde dehydrogenase family protein [Planctomycetota bacterium]|nr:aldehyde dehydrogenase family protein [Planctomycetota bacterium]
MERQPLRIGGALRETATWDAIASPFDGRLVGEAALGAAGDMDDAIAAAAAAQPAMAALPGHRRQAILGLVARRIGETSRDLALLIARESGKPIRFCRVEVARAQLTFQLAAAECSRGAGEVVPMDLAPHGEGRLALTLRVPRGPVAAISPFNFPLNLVAHKLAPAIAAGAAVVLKPPPQCPLTAHRLAQLCEDAGLPAGALSVVHCPPEVAQRMVVDERMAVLSFTGSADVGWRLKALAGRKAVLLELGGNAPCVLDEGTDLAAAMPALLASAWANAGQVCVRAQRFLVHASLADEFTERFVAATRAVRCGDPLDEETVVGPLIEARHVQRVLAWVAEAVAGGARLLCGGEADGQVMQPTVLSGVPREARVCREEVFGPVCVIERFERWEDALAAANDTRYGLQVGVYTNDLSRALAAFRTLRYGGVMLNDAPSFRVDNMPYGGSRDSGFGREGLRSAIEEYTEPRLLVLRGAPRA